MTNRTLLTTLALTALVGCARDARPQNAPMQSTQQTPMAQQPGHAGHMGHMGQTGQTGMMGNQMTAFVDPGAPNAKGPVQEATAVMHSTTGLRLGTIRFVDTGERGLEVTTSIEGLPSGTHAYHVHVYGDCSSPDFKSAGPHFHFTGSAFDESVKMITGNLGELTPKGEGRITEHTRIPNARLQGPYSVVGRSVVIHAEGNDPSVTPDGGAGARIACGVIGVANPSPPGQPSAQR
jgi:Cu-Zn family superoxide dismutase